MKKVDELTPEEFILPPLHQAARQRDLDKIRELLAQGFDVNLKCGKSANGEGGNTPLWFAAQGLPSGGVPIAELLVDAGASVNEPGEFNLTPMHVACSWGHADMVKFLHSRGANLSAVDDYGRTPVMQVKADYAEALATPVEKRTAGWEEWLSGIQAIVLFFDAIHDSNQSKHGS